MRGVSIGRASKKSLTLYFYGHSWDVNPTDRARSACVIPGEIPASAYGYRRRKAEGCWLGSQPRP